MDDRADCVQNIPARQMKGRRDFGLPGRFVIPLGGHDLVAAKPQLNPTSGVNEIINTGMERAETAPQGGICCIDDGVCFQCGYISLP